MAINFDTPIQFLKGVGPKLGAILRKRGYGTVGELLNCYPRSYEDRRAGRNISSLQPDEIVSLKVTFVALRSFNLGHRGKKAYELMVQDGSGRISCKFFRIPYRGYFSRFQPHQALKLTGKVTLYRGRLEFHHPELDDWKDDGPIEDQLLPIYIESQGLSSKKLTGLIGAALKDVQSGEFRGLQEVFPPWMLEKHNLIPRRQALMEIHQPPSGSGDEYFKKQSLAHRRLIFEEFFWLELYLAKRKQGHVEQKARSISSDGQWENSLREALPFDLTGAQDRALNEIKKDLALSRPMHRLVQGDVGSGKTLVAFVSALHGMESGFQVGLMAPTEILAEQHYRSAVKLFSPMGIKVAFLKGSQKSSEKKEQLLSIENGEAQFIVGTHALIQKSVEFNNLGLVIVDEQHRFGVKQRAALKNKGLFPHLLLMTATPIPRSLAMTVYGDLDVSIIDEMPKGRQEITTRVTSVAKRGLVVPFVVEQLQKGRQVYIIFPLVEESEKLDLANATDEYEKLKKEFSDFQTGLVHGRMSSDEKEAVMESFRKGDTQVLVSTTVVEVGVDVANANLIWINHSERFGLAQLHQLRGRVGRGSHKSYCVLMTGYGVSEEARHRLGIMEKSSDGFKVAEADLEIRGPGEFLGSRQSGLPGFQMANLVRDQDILNQARDAAFGLVKKDQNLKALEHNILRRKLSQMEIVG